MRYVIAGGGEYGTHYLRKLRAALDRGIIDLDEVLVVDKDPGCLVTTELPSLPIARLVVTDWNALGAEVFACRSDWIDDVWVPAPIAPHILSDWVVTRLGQDFGATVVPVTDPVPLPEIPFAQALLDGRILLSHAPGLCPVDCVEPASCAITNETRWWEMRDTIERLVASPEISPPLASVAMFFCKHHCDPGQNDVGGIAFRTIFAEAERVFEVARAGRGRIGIATLSSCHGVLNVFDLVPSRADTDAGHRDEVRPPLPDDATQARLDDAKGERSVNDASRCPICGQDNQCATASGDCWCLSVKIGPEILDQVPEAQRGQVCVCPACAGL